MPIELDKSFNKKYGLVKKRYREVLQDNVASGQIRIKAASEINDRSTNNSEDLGRDIKQLLTEMSLPIEANDYLVGQYHNIEAHYQKIKHYSKEQILNLAIDLRGRLDLEIDLVIALMNRANKIVTGYELRPAQILSILEFFRENGVNKFCQINTGEGKTTITSAIAVIKALQGETVDIITSNEVLAKDAIRERSDFYALFNLSTSHNNADHGYVKGLRDCYAHDIVYGTIGNFEFDYLRDRIQLAGTKGGRKFGSLIIDEADNVVLDNATHVAKTSGPIAGMEALKYVYINIWQELIGVEQRLGLANTELTAITVLHKELIKRQIAANKFNIKSTSIIPKFLEHYVDRKLDSWIDNAVRARYDYHQYQHYIIAKKDIEQQNSHAEESIIPLDVAVGVTQQNTVWTGLHPFVQIKHNLQITQDSLTSVFIANSEYIRLYNNISGLTGTLGSSEERGVIKRLYNANSTIIPTYKAGRMNYEDNLLVGNDKWLKTVADDAVFHAVNQARATLIVCRTMQDVLELEEQLSANKNIKVVSYLDEHDAYKIEEINKEAGIQPGTIVIATNIGGRGTDIKLSNVVRDNGGLHECTTFIASSRILKQALGRAGRQGEPGSAKIIIKQQEAEEFGISLKSNFSNQEIYQLVDKINDERIHRFIPQIKKVESDSKYFSIFAELYTDAKSQELNHFILEDLKLEWALAFDEKNDNKINRVFARFKAAIDSGENYEHQFINPYFAINYAQFILADKSSNDTEENSSYDKAKRILKQSCIIADHELLYVANMKLFELTISLVQRNELKRLATDGTSSPNLTEVREVTGITGTTYYKAEAKKYLGEAQQALIKRLKDLEAIISSEKFSTIILPQNSLNHGGENYLLKHLESKYVASQLQLQYVNILTELINNSANEFIYISNQNSLNELIAKIGDQAIGKKICQEELMQLRNLGEDCFSNVKTLPNVTYSSKVQQVATNQVVKKFAESALSLPSFTRIAPSTYSTLIGSSIFDIIRVILSNEASPQAKNEGSLFDNIAFDFAKVIESLKILQRVGQYIVEDISQVGVNNNNFFAGFTSRATEQVEIFEDKLANINPKGIVKAPKTSAPKKLTVKRTGILDPGNLTLEGSDANKEQSIDGIDTYFGKYTLEAIRNILQLRVREIGIDNVRVISNNYLFVDKESNNIQGLIDELHSFKDSAIVLIPLNLSNKHAVGMICYVECGKSYDENNNINKLTIYYIDPENNQIPNELEQIFSYNQLAIKQLTTEVQQYANCGSEVIENFILYLTGQRLSQEEAIQYHSLLVEQDLLINDHNTTQYQKDQYKVGIEITDFFANNNNSHYNELDVGLAGLIPDFTIDDIT